MYQSTKDIMTPHVKLCLEMFSYWLLFGVILAWIFHMVGIFGERK